MSVHVCMCTLDYVCVGVCLLWFGKWPTAALDAEGE